MTRACCFACQHITIPTLFGRATAVLGDHANLNTVVDRLRDLCLPVDASTGASTEVRELLEVLRDRLRVHFAAEEDVGYFGMLVATQPALGATITRLENDHLEFLSMLESLLALAGDPTRGHELAELNDFLGRFHAHERAENALLHEFFLQYDGDSLH